MRARMRIAVVTDSIYPFHHGGKEIRYHELLRRLAVRADVHVYTMKWWPGPSVLRSDGVTYHAVSRQLPLYVNGRRSLVQAAWFAVGCVRLLGERFDVVEADHIPYAPVYVLRLVSWLKGKRLVVTWHEVWGNAAWTTYLGRLGPIAWLVEKGAMRLPDQIIAASAQTGERLAAILGSDAKIVVAPNGLDLQAIAEAPVSPDRADLVFVGRLLGHKGVDTLIDAVALLAERGRPVTCRVIGRGPELDALRARARARAVDHLVEFRDDIDGLGDLYSLLKAGRVFVFPSTREGFGIAVLEAIACGLPVITSDHPDNLARFLVTSPERGVVCAPTANAFADAVETMLPARTTAWATSSGSCAGTDHGAQGPPEELGAYDWRAVTEVVATALGVPNG